MSDLPASLPCLTGRFLSRSSGRRHSLILSLQADVRSLHSRPDRRRYAGGRRGYSPPSGTPRSRWSARSREYIVGGGGKRLRPALVICSRRRMRLSRRRQHHELAAVVEFIHTATLLHDDVVDESDLRRGQPDRQRAVRQCRQRAGRRFPLFARVPDDGRGRKACA